MNQTVLITGASTGIGRATVEYFQQKGWNVVATMRTPDKETELQKLDNVLVTRLDVTDPSSVEAAVAATLEKFGSLDALVNNAGYGAFGPLEAFSMEGVRRQFDTNVTGLIEVTKAVIPVMRKQGGGYIVNISSVGGQFAFPLGSLYHGTKFAVEGLSEGLQYELAPAGIKVKVIEPGAIKTDFAGRSFDFVNDESIEVYQPVVQALNKALLSELDKGAEPVEVAEVIYQSVTDGTDKLRYPAAGGAENFLAMTEGGDEKLFASIRDMMGL